MKIKKMLAPWKKSYDKPRQHIKKQRHHFANRDPYSQSYGFSSSQVQASPTQWTGVWVNSRSWWWTERPGVLQSMGWQRVRHKWASELTDWCTDLRAGPKRRLRAKNWCFGTMVLEMIFECPLNSKEIKLVNPKGNQPWIFIARTDDEAAILWPPDAKRWLTGKEPDAGKDWKQMEKRATKDEMVS